jgi:hypothetical protein
MLVTSKVMGLIIVRSRSRMGCPNPHPRHIHRAALSMRRNSSGTASVSLVDVCSERGEGRASHFLFLRTL